MKLPQGDHSPDGTASQRRGPPVGNAVVVVRDGVASPNVVVVVVWPDMAAIDHSTVTSRRPAIYEMSARSAVMRTRSRRQGGLGPKARSSAQNVPGIGTVGSVRERDQLCSQLESACYALCLQPSPITADGGCIDQLMRLGVI